MKILARMSRIAETSLTSGAGILMILISVLVFGEVISRYIFQRSHDFVPFYTPWAMAWMVYFMLGVITKRRQHILVDILLNRLPERYRPLLLLVTDILSVFFAVLLCWASIKYLPMIRQLGVSSTTIIRIPTWIVMLCVPLGGIFFGLLSLERIFVDIQSLIKPTVGKGQ